MALLLYVFLAVVGILIWRDLRTAARLAVQEEKGYGYLEVVEGGATALMPGARYPLSSHTSLGRATSNAIVLPDPAVSSQHALLTYRAGRWWLEDLGSRNGTLLNGVPIERPVVVDVGDIIGLGTVRLKLVPP